MLKKHAPTPSKALKVAEEAIDGEHKIEEREKKRAELQSLLGLSHTYEEKVEYTDSKKRSVKDVGKRNPTRDEIGIAESGT